MQVAPFIIVLPFKPFSFSNLKKAEGGGGKPPPPPIYIRQKQPNRDRVKND